MGHTVDYLLGGGLGFFVPNTTSGSTRPDGKDVLAYAASHGYTVALNRTAFDKLDGQTKPYLGLFHKSHMTYEVCIYVIRDFLNLILYRLTGILPKNPVSSK